MALVECPNCKNEIEALVGKCDFCGAELEGGDEEKKICDVPVGSVRPAEETDLVTCVRNIEKTCALYQVFKILKAVLVVIFWIVCIFTCSALVAAALVGTVAIGVSQSIGSSDAVLVFLNLLSAFSIVPVLMGLFYRSAIVIPFDIVNTLISGIYARKNEFSRNKTLAVFKNPSPVYGVDDAYGYSRLIYPFLIGRSRGKVSGILLTILEYGYSIFAPVSLILVYLTYLVALVVSVLLMNAITSVSALLLSLFAGAFALTVFFIVLLAIRTILDIIGNSVREYTLSKWEEALRE